RDPDLLPGPNICLNGLSRQPHIWILGSFSLLRLFCLHPAVFFQKMSLGISAFHLIDADAVSHTESVFVGQPLGLHRKAVQRTCHNGKRSVSAFRGLIAELLRKIEQFSE